jgi:hypothetical protein
LWGEENMDNPYLNLDIKSMFSLIDIYRWNIEDGGPWFKNIWFIGKLDGTITQGPAWNIGILPRFKQERILSSFTQ